jgi:hypothetical protein
VKKWFSFARLFDDWRGRRARLDDVDGWLGVERVIRARGVSVDAGVGGKEDDGDARAFVPS